MTAWPALARPAARTLLAAFREALARDAAPGTRRFPSCRSPAAWWASPATTSCATSSACRGPPAGAGTARRCREAAYLAAESLLVFDHLTRRIALLHAGSEADRARAAPRGACACCAGRCRRRVAEARHRPGGAEPVAATNSGAAVGPGQALHRPGRRLPAGAVGALLGRALAVAVRDLPRAAPAESVALHVLPRPRRRPGGRLVARGAGEAARAGAPRCGPSPARARAATTARRTWRSRRAC